jgi:hypothetical protein
MNERMEPHEPIGSPDDEKPELAPPQPIRPNNNLPSLGTALGVLMATGGAVFMLVSAGVGATRGGTRSFKLKWEQRQHEVADAIAADIVSPHDDSSEPLASHQTPDQP